MASYITIPQILKTAATETKPGAIRVVSGLSNVEGKYVGFSDIPIKLTLSEDLRDPLSLPVDSQIIWTLHKIGSFAVMKTETQSALSPIEFTIVGTDLELESVSLNQYQYQLAKQQVTGGLLVKLEVIPSEDEDPAHTYTLEFEMKKTTIRVNDLDVIPVYRPFIAGITKVDGNKIHINQNWDAFEKRLQPYASMKKPQDSFDSWTISYKHLDKRDLNTYLHFGDDNLLLVTNTKTDITTFPEIPYSVIYKLYEPLSDDIEEKDKTFVVREMLPELTKTIELVPYDQEDEDVLVLRKPDASQVDSPVTNRSTTFKSYSELTTTDSKLKKEIEDKFLTGSLHPTELNIDYTNYDNYVNFSSAEKRLKNFKYKIEKIETYTQESSSLVGVTNANADLKMWDDRIRDTKNNFDDYEKYLYNISSSYESSSMGEFFDTTWPKTGSGTYFDPYKPVSSTNSLFTSWYGSTVDKTGQLYSASLYDKENPNRLVNLLPAHVKDDVRNEQFLDFIDMMGHHFDVIWTYTKALSDITDRQNDLSKGFSKELVFSLAQSLGWNIKDGTDLLGLERVGFGQKLSGTSYSLYTSGSLDSPGEGDISKEITKRLISSMPFLLKTKGTITSLKGILSCYGIPSTILRVREYGGLQKKNNKANFEITRKFTKALGFRSSQYIRTTWVNDTNSSRKPDTVEFRFKSPTGSDQILVQKDTKWAIKLKDNGSTDNYGSVAFMLSGDSGYQEITSSQLPVYDNEFYSVMLKKTKMGEQLFSYPSFETGSLFNPPFLTDTDSAVNGTLAIVSSSIEPIGVRTGTKAIKHTNTSKNDASYTLLFKDDPVNTSYNASVTSVSQFDTVMFSAFAKASASKVDSVVSLRIYELDSNENVVNWDDETLYTLQDGGTKTSEKIGVDEAEWKQVQVQKTVKFPNTSKLGIQFRNEKPESVVYWDDVSVRKTSANTDTITDVFNYELFVKKYDSGVDRIIHSSKSNLIVSGSTNHTVSSSYNAAWTGSGTVYVGGHSSGTGSAIFNASRFSGSMMEFRYWNSPLKEEAFDNHVAAPKSFNGNHPSASYTDLVLRYSLNDDSDLSSNIDIRDSSADQSYMQSGSAHGFTGNFFHSVIDKTKTFVPNYGPNRRLADKIRIENNFISGSGASLSRVNRWDYSSNDFSPLDSPKLGIYFSPVDAVNEDIIFAMSDLDFNQYIGDPRDRFESEYRELKNISNEYFKKYKDNNDFWDYMRLIKYYDQALFKQLKHLVPARAKTHMGTLIEGNIFERPKSPVQRNNPSSTEPKYEKTINLSQVDNTDSGSAVLTLGTEYRNYTGTVESDLWRSPSLYKFAFKDGMYNNGYEDRTLYVSGSAKFGGPDSVFQEATGAVILNNRLSVNNREYRYYYNTTEDYKKTYLGLTSGSGTTETHIPLKYSTWTVKRLDNPDAFINYYSSKSLATTDLDPEYQYITAWNRSFFEGVKQTKNTTTDGDLPVIVRISAPTVAVPVDVGISELEVVENEG